jgi:hypothetical protein
MAKTIPTLSKAKLKSADEQIEFAENIINSVREPMLALDQDLRVVKASKSFYNFFKVTPTETIGTLIYNLGNNQWDIPKLRELLETIIPEKTTFDNYEVEHDFSTIGKRIMLLHARQIDRALGKKKIILLTIEDITERKFAEESFWETSRLTNDYVDNLFNHAQVPIIVLDASTAIIRINNSFEKLSGYDWDELSDKKIDILFPKNKITSTLELIKKTQSSEKPEVIEIDILTKGKEIRRVLWNSANIFDKDGKNILATIAYEINKRKRAEVLLEESEERYRLLYEAITDGILIADTETRTFKYANPALCRLLGYTEEELRMMSLEDIHPKQESQRVIAEFEKLAREESTLAPDIPCLRKDGKIFYADISATNITFDGRQYLMGLFRDSTERKRSEEALQNSEARLHILVQTIPDLIWLKDVDGIYLSCNKMFERFFGASEADIVGKTDYDFVDRELADFFRENDRRSMAAGKPTSNEESITFADDGHSAFLDTIKTPMYDTQGTLIGVLGIGRDITMRKWGMEALRKSETDLKEAQRVGQLGSWDWDIATDTITWSEEYYRIYGLDPTQPSPGYGEHLKLYMPESAARLDAAVKKSMQTGEGYQLDLEQVHRDSTSRWITAIGEVKRDDKGQIVGLRGTAQDITEHKRAERELIVAKEKAEAANKLKDAFIANISHEIRTPLTGILGMTSIIKETYQNNIKKEDEVLFEGIDISSNRIIRTVDMILNYSRLQVGEFNLKSNKINISKICTNLVKEFNTAAKNKSLALSFQNDCGDTVVFADEYSITMAISNLIDNAIKYTPKGSVNVILHKGENDELILDIMDTGIGINTEYLDHIFESYRQEEMGYGRAYEGIGLGLAIVKKTLDLNKAVINVESKKGEGTTFSINFGKAEQLPEDKAKPVIAATIHSAKEELQNKVVLLVEDDLMNQVTIRRFIENSYNVMVTGSSDEAMEIIKNGKVDIILMDISIKGSMNGLELTKELKASKEFSHIPIIAVTAHALESDMKNSLAAGCNSYLPKPFTRESLLNLIAGYAHK